MKPPIFCMFTKGPFGARATIGKLLFVEVSGPLYNATDEVRSALYQNTWPGDTWKEICYETIPINQEENENPNPTEGA